MIHKSKFAINMHRCLLRVKIRRPIVAQLPEWCDNDIVNPYIVGVLCGILYCAGADMSGFLIGPLQPLSDPTRGNGDPTTAYLG